MCEGVIGSGSCLSVVCLCICGCTCTAITCSLQMERAGLALPNMDHIKKKEKDFQSAKNFDFTDEHVDHVSLCGGNSSTGSSPTGSSPTGSSHFLLVATVFTLVLLVRCDHVGVQGGSSPVCACVYVHTYVHVYICMYVCMYVCVLVCVCVHVLHFHPNPDCNGEVKVQKDSCQLCNDEEQTHHGEGC